MKTELGKLKHVNREKNKKLLVYKSGLTKRVTARRQRGVRTISDFDSDKPKEPESKPKDKVDIYKTAYDDLLNKVSREPRKRSEKMMVINDVVREREEDEKNN